MGLLSRIFNTKTNEIGTAAENKETNAIRHYKEKYQEMEREGKKIDWHEYEKSIELCKTKIQHFVQETINKKTADITKTATKLEGLNPVKILSRGYSIAEKDGKAVNSAKMLKSGDEFTLRFSDGEIKAKATGE